MTKAAGVLFISNGRLLLLKRAGPGDYPAHWALPGGGVEDGETEEEAAKREVAEETGFSIDGKLHPYARSITGDVEYTTFLRGEKFQFEPPSLDLSEHTEHQWVSIGGPYPEPLHPGVEEVLAKLTITELDVARGVRDGYFPAPTRLQNNWFFPIRIFGTGVAFRPKGEEFTFRDPALYLNDEMLARCNGLPVVLMHPEEPALNGDQLSQRIIGTVMLTYLAREDGLPSDDPTEVWGIARVYNRDAAEVLTKHVTSTSPGVLFFSPAFNTRVPLAEGESLLVETSPNMVDHLAICPVGVWDKGGPPAGVKVTVSKPEDLTVAEEKKDGEGDTPVEKKDEATPIERLATSLDSFTSKLDEMNAKMDAQCARMDAMEKWRHDSEEDQKPLSEMDKKDESEDKAEEKKDESEEKKTEDKAEDKKDESEDKKDEGQPSPGLKEEEKKDAEPEPKKDAADSKKGNSVDDNTSAEILRRLQALEVREERTPEEENALSAAQMKADEAFQAHGRQAPRAVQGEPLAAYRLRLLGEMKSFSPRYKDVPLAALTGVLDIAESDVFKDAIDASNNPAFFGDGSSMRERRRKDPMSGREYIEFVGTRPEWLDDFRMVPSGLKAINKAS